MEKTKRIIFIIIIILLVLAGAIYVDYFICKQNGTYPKISIKKTINSDEKVYNAVFYKVWYCDTNGVYTIGGYKDVDAVCPAKYKYKDGYYENGAGLKISEYNLELIKNYYDYEIIETFNSEKQVENAVYVVNNYKHLDYRVATTEEGQELVIGNAKLVEFPKFTLDEKHKYVWSYSKTNYCYKDNTYANYDGEKCGEFKPLVYDSDWCNYYENSNFAYNEEIKAKCKE